MPAGPSIPAFQALSTAAVITEDLAEKALAALEDRRAQYGAISVDLLTPIEALARQMGWPDLVLRAQLVLADLELREGNVLDVAARLDSILVNAERIGDSFTMARSHFLLCDAHHSLGDPPSARIHGIRSVELLPDDAPIGIRIDHLRMLGTAFGPGPDAARCHSQALDLTRMIGDTAREIAIHNSYSYFAYQIGKALIARDHADQMVQLSELRGIPLLASQLDTVARVHLQFGRAEAAIEVLRPLIPRSGDALRAGGIADLDPKPYGLPECQLTLAEAHRALGRYATARLALDVAFHVTEVRKLGWMLARLHLARARLRADVGDFEGAFAAHVAYHQATVEHQASEKEARARRVQASYDASEDRKDAENFRELAMRDALTGLYNRRFLDEALVSTIAETRISGRPISAAIVDADFFKRVNDELSHEVGDAVLRRLAEILVASVVTPEVVGRLGGEEFGIIMPGADAATALERCETVRRAVDEHDFGDLTGTIPVKVSIGVATCLRGEATPGALLASADEQLYAAKRSGRNRVMGDIL